MRILIADDESVILDGLTRTVRKAAPDAEVLPFSGGQALLDWYRDNRADIAFLDIEMPRIDGLTLARRLREQDAQLNIIFTTSYPQYARESYDLRASGYLLKPVSESDIRRELENLRFALRPKADNRLKVTTFGSFRASVNGENLRFRYSKTMELLAYIVDRNGSYVTNGELQSVLWEGVSQGEKTASYLRQLRKDLIDTLEAAGCRDAVDQRRGAICIQPDRIDCDYYDWLKGDLATQSRYQGEYMAQYSWAENTNGWLSRMSGS